MKRSVIGMALLVLLGGCGGSDHVKTVAVSGTLYVDGAPHGPAALVLYPVLKDAGDKRPSVTGQVSRDGKFTLMTYQSGDGAPPGEYQVSLAQGGSEAGSTDPAKMLAGTAVTQIKPLTVTIPEEGTKTLEIRAESAGGGQPKASKPGGLLGT